MISLKRYLEEDQENCVGLTIMRMDRGRNAEKSECQWIMA